MLYSARCVPHWSVLFLLLLLGLSTCENDFGFDFSTFFSEFGFIIEQTFDKGGKLLFICLRICFSLIARAGGKKTTTGECWEKEEGTKKKLLEMEKFWKRRNLLTSKRLETCGNCAAKINCIQSILMRIAK